jgi:hypothetical protein
MQAGRPLAMHKGDYCFAPGTEALFSIEQLRFARERMVYIYQSGVDFKCPQSNRPL